MRFSDVKMIEQDTPKGEQAILDYGSYQLSIIRNEMSYGNDQQPYEIGVFAAADGVAGRMTELPGITAKGDTVRGFLNAEEVDGIMLKMYMITGKAATQV